MMMDLIGEKVLHRVFGDGVIIDVQIDEESKGYIKVQFPSKTSQFSYPKAFHDSFLTAVNHELQEWIDTLKPPVPTPEPPVGQTPPPPPPPPPTPSPTSKVRTFLVFQGLTYDDEKAGEYIWAPFYDARGGTRHFWERLVNVREGDIIVHVSKGYIRAFSHSCGRCYRSPNPFGGSNQWDQTGRRVDCQYVPLNHPLRTMDFKDDIVSICRTMLYPPFRQDGNGNLGYLFDLPSELMKVFLNGALQRNPMLNDVRWIRDFLKKPQSIC